MTVAVRDEYKLGYLAAAAQAARGGSETLAVEMCATVGVTHWFELDHIGLSAFDKKPLRKLLLMEDGRR